MILQIQPISHLCYQTPVSHTELAKILGQVIVRINQEEIRDWCKTPLEAGIDIEVVKLVIVLYKGSQE